MRVVWITHNYPRYRGDVAGAFLHPLAQALRRRDVDVRVVAPSDGGDGGRSELDGVPVDRVRYADPDGERLAYGGMSHGAARSMSGMRTFNALRRALRTGARGELAGDRHGLVHAHWWLPAGLATPPGIPSVLTCHGSDIQLLQKSALARWLAQAVFRRARVVTTVSHALATIIQRRTGVVVPDDAVQPMPVVDADRPWTTGGGGDVVIGRLTRQKRVHLAIEARALERDRGSAVPLTIVGDGPERPALHGLAAHLGVGELVRFVGAVAPAAVPAILASADCCVMPAIGEGFGLAAAEALMQGVPVVACTDGGGLTDVVANGGAGRLVAPTATAIADALASLRADPEAEAAARVAGLEWRARLSADHVAERCLTWYERALHA